MVEKYYIIFIMKFKFIIILNKYNFFKIIKFKFILYLFSYFIFFLFFVFSFLVIAISFSIFGWTNPNNGHKWYKCYKIKLKAW